MKGRRGNRRRKKINKTDKAMNEEKKMNKLRGIIRDKKEYWY
jgi:hypothetical protein